MQVEKEPSSCCRKSPVCSLHHHGSCHFLTNRHGLCLPLFWYRLQSPREKPVNVFPVTSDVVQSANILLQFFTWWHKSPTTANILQARTSSLSASTSAKSQTVFAASEVKSCILPLELSLSWGLCCTGVVAPVGAGDCAQTAPHHHSWAQNHFFHPSFCECFCMNWCANMQHVSCLCCFT